MADADRLVSYNDSVALISAYIHFGKSRYVEPCTYQLKASIPAIQAFLVNHLKLDFIQKWAANVPWSRWRRENRDLGCWSPIGSE